MTDLKAKIRLFICHFRSFSNSRVQPFIRGPANCGVNFYIM